MGDLKDGLSKVIDTLKDIEAEARKLTNKNLADVIASGRLRLEQATEHPDVDMQPGDEQHGLPSEPAAPAFNDPGAALQAEEAARRAAFETSTAPFPGTVQASENDPDAVKANDPNALHPGDPAVSFQDQNPDFKHPDNVNLNTDGTLKTAPNTLGTSDDKSN